MEKLEFIDENGEKTQFYVIEETRINGINYLLVSESDNEDEEAEAYILKDTSDAASEEAVYGNFEYCYCSARPSGHCHPWHCQNHLDDCPSLFSGYASRKTLYQKIKWQEK